MINTDTPRSMGKVKSYVRAQDYKFYIGMDPNKPSCWDGYKATGTKMKDGRQVPDCKKEDVAYENRQVAYEPEKHKDPDESDKPYSQRSRAARMRDPKRGINSPAFKKFMADRGM